jgi:hypothetical protein
MLLDLEVLHRPDLSMRTFGMSDVNRVTSI